MRDYRIELEKRVDFIKKALETSGAEGIVFGNSGGKDSALVGILCKKACDNTIGIIMPCGSKRNFDEDLNDGKALADQYNIKTMTIDLTPHRTLFTDTLKEHFELTEDAISNIAPRLRMTTLYAVARCKNLLVAGTDNKSEIYMGYFTKWGDGAYDLNPIADLTVTEVYEFLEFLEAPKNIIEKVPSAGLYEGQTDEKDMGVTYAAIDNYILTGCATKEDKAIIDRFHRSSEHKRRMPLFYGE